MRLKARLKKISQTKKVKAADIVEQKALVEIEMTKRRPCPVCTKLFTWRKTKDGQIFCSRSCMFQADYDTGRPTKLTEDVLRKLKQAWSWDANDDEAASHAGITPQTLSRYLKDNPDLFEEKKRLKDKVVLDARKKTVNDIKTNAETAKWYLERKRKNEFASKNILTSEVITGEMDPEAKKRAVEILHEYGEDDD